MEKILLAMDGYKQNMYAIDFACYLAKLTKSRLTGVFMEGGLEDFLPASTEEAVGEVAIGRSAIGEAAATQHVNRFREACISREVTAKVHKNRGVPLADILLESRFADLIVLDPEASFRKIDKEFPGHFIRDVLLAAECPVIVSPYHFDHLDEVIFAYNGTSSSVFAIKQFTYLFPEFYQKKAIVVNVSEGGGSSMEETFKMKEWLSAHYEELEFVFLKGDVSDELLGYLLQRKDALVVLGAYGRGILSRFLKPSHASLLLRTINLPIFMAHR